VFSLTQSQVITVYDTEYLPVFVHCVIIELLTVILFHISAQLLVKVTPHPQVISVFNIYVSQATSVVSQEKTQDASDVSIKVVQTLSYSFTSVHQ
jgi:hypothetical protein